MLLHFSQRFVRKYIVFRSSGTGDSYVNKSLACLFASCQFCPFTGFYVPFFIIFWLWFSFIRSYLLAFIDPDSRVVLSLWEIEKNILLSSVQGKAAFYFHWFAQYVSYSTRVYIYILYIIYIYYINRHLAFYDYRFPKTGYVFANTQGQILYSLIRILDTGML